MAFDENNYEPLPTEGEELPEESSNNRTFMIAVGILGGLILIAVACLGAVYVFGNSGANTAQVAAAAAAATQTEVANQIKMRQALTATSAAQQQPTATLSPTPTTTPPVSVASPTGTPDVVLTTAAGGAGPGTQIAATATVAAALTKAAEAQKAAVTAMPSPTRLAGTGIADEYGIPGLVVMALAFIIVILFARRLRFSPTLR
jgi:hypothetical protein